MTYPRTYERRCEECGHPIVGAARNQRMHDVCRRRRRARARQRTNECRRAAAGLFPMDRVPLERMKIGRRAPASAALERAYYRWLRCRTPGCRARFYAGRNAKHCHTCRARRIRARNARQHQRRKLRGRRPPQARQLRRAS